MRYRSASERESVILAERHGWIVEGRNGMGHLTIRHQTLGRMPMAGVMHGRGRRNFLRDLRHGRPRCGAETN